MSSLDEKRFTYKLHPTTIVLRSQQINLLESQANDDDLTDEERLVKKDTNSLIPQYSIPAQIYTPQADSLLANRTTLLNQKDPTLLLHSHQQQQQSNLAREIEQHIQQTTQQQQSAFTGPFLLYRNPDWNRLKTLKTVFYVAIILDCLLLAYLYLVTTYIPALTNFSIRLPLFGLMIESTERPGTVRKLFGPVLFLMGLAINALGVFGFLKKQLRLLNYFIAVGVSWIIINTVAIAVSSDLGVTAIVAIVRLAWFGLVLWIAMKARTRMSVNWYMTSQF